MIRERVVFDCNVFLQALLSSRGPAFGCIELARAGDVAVFVSPYVLQELRRTPQHPDLKRFSRLTAESVELFIVDLMPKMHMISNVPEVFVIIRNAESEGLVGTTVDVEEGCLLYTSPSPRD